MKPTNIRFSLKDKFLLSFLGLAVVLTALLTILASRVNEILPEMHVSQAERYKAQLKLRDIRESVADLRMAESSDVAREEQLRAAFQEYENSLSIAFSPGVYEAIVSQDKGQLIQDEEKHLSVLREHVRTYERELGVRPNRAQAAFDGILEETSALEALNNDTIGVLEMAQATTRRYIITFFLLSVAILLLGITLFAQFLAVWITKPLKKIEQAARRIASGDLSQELQADSRDELGVLMTSFDDMRKKVLLSLDEVRAFATRDEMLINSIVDIIIAVDEDKCVILCNAAAEALAGTTAKDAAGTPMKELFAFEELGSEKEEREILEGVISSGQARSLLHPIAVSGVKTGKKVPVTISVAPFVQGDGRRGAVIVMRDVSENMELDTLRQEFVSITSHQLRTPLTAIRWLLEVLIRGDKESRITMDPKHRDTLRQAYSRTLSMSELVSSLLALSRVDAQKVNAKLAPINLKELLEKLRVSLASAAERKQMALSVSCDIAEPILTDEVILMQILTNIVGNSIKYSPDKTSVEVTAKAENDTLLFTVTDHGIGIPEDQQQSIFQKFYRAKNALTFTPEGTGIGLYMVQSFAHLLGGSVRFVSKENVGTTFTITFPLKTPHA